MGIFKKNVKKFRIHDAKFKKMFGILTVSGFILSYNFKVSITRSPICLISKGHSAAYWAFTVISYFLGWNKSLAFIFYQFLNLVSHYLIISCWQTFRKLWVWKFSFLDAINELDDKVRSVTVFNCRQKHVTVLDLDKILPTVAISYFCAVFTNKC